MTVQQTFEIVFVPLVVLAALFVVVTAVPRARAEIASDFSSDVHKGLSSGAQDPILASIRTYDYKTSWDEFGTNVLVDGTRTPGEIEKDLHDDIVNSLQAELSYNQKDENYLQLRHSSPEEIVALEGDGGGDLLPQDAIDPNPSLDANPDVNPSALDMPASAVDLSSALLTPEVEAASDTASMLPDNLVPPEGGWEPAAINLFETILSAEPSAQLPVDVPSEAPAADQAPDEALPPVDAPSM